MSLKAGRVGVNPADVDPIDGHINPSSLEGYTKEEADAKFSTKEEADAKFSTKDDLRIAINDIDLLMGSKLNNVYGVMGENGAVNIFDVSHASSATNLVSAVNDKGIITFKDVASAQWSSTYIGVFKVKAGLKYKIFTNSSSLVGYGRIGFSKSSSNAPTSDTYYPNITLDTGNNPSRAFVFNDAIKTGFTANEDATIYAWYCNEYQGHTEFSVGIEISDARDTNPDFEPYAMTNRELTVNKLDISTLKTITADAADFSAFKTAIANL